MSRRERQEQTRREEPISTVEPSGRVRRRTNLPAREQPQRGRLLSLLQQRDRQGNLRRSGREEPRPRREEHEAYTPQEALPAERGASRKKRIAWSLGALTAIGGTGAFYLRRRRNRLRERRSW